MVGFTGNLRDFPLPALYGDGVGGSIFKFLTLCVLIAQTEGLRFWAPHSHSFFLICSLHLCNYCSGVGFAVNLSEVPLPAFYCDGVGGSICKLVPLCSLIAQTEELRFWAPHSHSFFLICSLL